MTNANCYKCIHRRTVPGDAHSSCAHPIVAEQGGGLVSFLMAAYGGNPRLQGAIEKLEVRANPHGVRNGWFAWPFNFDPVWLENCNGFEPKDSQPAPEPETPPKPKDCDCDDPSQCWEPCGSLGHSEEHARVSELVIS